LAVGTTSYVLNRVTIRPPLKLTPYEIYKGRKPNISHLKVFGYKCFVLNNGKESLDNFDAKAKEGLFLGYSSTSKACRFFNKNLLKIEELVHVVFDESNPQKEG